MKYHFSFLLGLLFAGQGQLVAQSELSRDSSLTFQTKTSSSELAANSYLPQVIPPSPNAASLGRYGEFPVELSKGTPSISLPLYEILSGSIKVPISLSYHASGVRVNDVSSSVGLSWVLNAGGAITRSVNGLPDERSDGFRGYPSPSQPSTGEFWCYIGNISEMNGWWYDGFPDNFFYNFNGNSGKFMWANKNRTSGTNLSSAVPVTIPYKPLKIEGQSISGGIYKDEYTITDLDGTIYSFGQQTTGTKPTEVTIVNSASMSYTSSWYLSSIVSANRLDTVRFEYSTAASIATILWGTTLTKQSSTEQQAIIYSYDRNASTSVVGTVLPSAIYFKNGKVSFNYSSDRQDQTNGSRLKSIYIYKKDVSGSYSELKHFDLTHSYFNCQDGYSQIDWERGTVSQHSGNPYLKRLRLDKLTEKSPALDSLPPYQFTYYDNTPLPIYGSYAQDYWGFYNGATANTKFLIEDTDAALTATPSLTNGANRTSNFSYAIAGTLKEIKYPTAGRTVFTFEANQLINNGDTLDGGGIRIKKIVNYQGANQISGKRFSYPSGYFTNNLYNGHLNTMSYKFESTQQIPSRINCNFYNEQTTLSYPENLNFMLGTSSGSAINYQKVDEITINPNDNGLGKKERVFAFAMDATSPLFPFNTVSNDWKRGHLLEENDYSWSEGEFKMVRQVKNHYSTFLTDSLVTGYATRVDHLPITGTYSIGGQPCTISFVSYCAGSDPRATTKHEWTYWALNYEIGTVFLDSTITQTYNEAGSGGLREKQAFTYARATHQQQIRKTFTDSKNQVWETTYKYPNELAASITDYQEMVNRHIFTPVIEEEHKIEETSTRLIKTNYKKWYPSTSFGGVSGFFAPLSVEVQQAGGPLIPQIVFGEKLSNPTENGYDAQAHPVVYTELNGTVTRLSWWQEHGKRDQVNVQTINGAYTTTYDYHPLIGIKSITDPEGKATYYEYDSFNRLKNVRNDNAAGSIRASYCYNYAGQAINCTAISSTTGVVSPPALMLLADLKENSLPVTLVDFVATSENHATLLTWTTTSEINSDHFEIEHGADGKSWTKIGSVNALGIPPKLGNPSTQHYSFRDETPLPGPNFYRLKMVDTNASHAYSRIEYIYFGAERSVYPNPLIDREKLQISSLSPYGILEVKIYDLSGKVVYNGLPSEEGIDLSQLSAGSYIVQITGTNGTISTHRISKQ